MQKLFLATASMVTLAACITTYSVAKEHTAKGGKSAAAADPTTTTWETYGGQPAGDHYSSLDQINQTNVSQLKWRGRTIRMSRAGFKPTR